MLARSLRIVLKCSSALLSSAAAFAVLWAGIHLIDCGERAQESGQGITEPFEEQKRGAGASKLYLLAPISSL